MKWLGGKYKSNFMNRGLMKKYYLPFKYRFQLLMKINSDDKSRVCVDIRALSNFQQWFANRVVPSVLRAHFASHSIVVNVKRVESAS